MVLGPAPRHRGIGRLVRWPQVGWELCYPVQFLVCEAANDPQFMPGMCLGFHEWSDNGDGLCIGDMAPVSNVMPGCRGPSPIQKINNKLGPYPIGNGLSKRKQL